MTVGVRCYYLAYKLQRIYASPASLQDDSKELPTKSINVRIIVEYADSYGWCAMESKRSFSRCSIISETIVHCKATFSKGARFFE